MTSRLPLPRWYITFCCICFIPLLIGNGFYYAYRVISRFVVESFKRSYRSYQVFHQKRLRVRRRALSDPVVDLSPTAQIGQWNGFFLKLPPEIRLQIYGHLFEDEGHDPICLVNFHGKAIVTTECDFWNYYNSGDWLDSRIHNANYVLGAHQIIRAQPLILPLTCRQA